MTTHQRAVDQEKCFGLVGGGGSKLALMLCGISIRFLQPPLDQTCLHLQACGGRVGEGREGEESVKAAELTFFSDDFPPPPPPSLLLLGGPESKCKCCVSLGAGLWDLFVLIIRSESESLCSTTKCVFPRCSVTGITQSSAGFVLRC